MSQFQLFPPPSPEERGSKNPFRNRNRKLALEPQPPSPIPLEELKRPQTEAVLLQIIEDTNNVRPPPKAYLSQRPAMTVPETICEPESESLYDSTPRVGPDRAGSSSPESKADRYVARQKSPQPLESETVPIKSIFPQYNPQVPLSQQQYYPQAAKSPPSRHNPRGLTLTPAPEIDRALGPKTVPASVLNFPTDALEPLEVQYSSATQLKGLWEVANGQRPQNDLGTFNLQLNKVNHATFAFGDPQAPFYTMQTYSTDELSITRAYPLKPSSSIPVMMLKLEDRGRRLPPSDGLVTLLFSRLAAMLAIDEAEQLAKQHQLTPAQASEVEGNALERAAAQESCRLLWNNEKRLYELQHPSHCKPQPPALVGAAGIPLSPIRSKYAGILHITISPPSKDPNSRHQPPTILVTTPLSANAVEGAATQAASPRTSTLPLSDADADEPLAALDLATMTLSISATAITSTIPSLYAIDSLVAALLAVAASDERTNPVLADMHLYNPAQPSAPSFPGPSSHPHPAPLFTGPLITTLAEREDVDAATRVIDSVKKSSSSSAPHHRSFWPWTRSKQKPKRRKNKQVVPEQFDLEKYGRSNTGATGSRPEPASANDNLPGATRGILRLLFWSLKMVVGALTVAVKIIAWVLVRVSRCVTSERF